MSSHGEVEIIDRHGWIKRHPLEQTITHIGSDPTNEIVLEAGRGEGVAPRHLQVICWPDVGYRHRLVNLGDTDVQVGSGGAQALPPRSAMDLFDGETVRLGDFTLVFHLGAGPAVGVAGRSEHIGLDLSLPRARLAPNQTLEGIITVRNLGEQEGVQFELDLEGLPPNCYQIEPPPLFFPGAEEEMRLYLYHRGTQPVAGEHYITIRAVAPRAYPAEEATVSQVIQVLPFYKHRLRLLSEEEWRTEAGLAVPVEEEQAPKVEPAFLPLRADAREREAGPPPTPPEEIKPLRVKATPPKQAAEAEAGETGEGPPPPRPEAEKEQPLEAQALSAPQAEAERPPAEAAPPLPVQDEPPAHLTPPPEEEQPPAEPVPPPPEEAPLPEAVSPPPPEEAAPPPPPEDWWAAEVVSPPEEQVRKVQIISPPRPEEIQPPEVVAALSQATNGDWWAAEAEAHALPPAQEDWWDSTEAAGPPAQAKKVKVLRAEAPADWEEAETSSPPQDAEEWWEAEDEAQ